MVGGRGQSILPSPWYSQGQQNCTYALQTLVNHKAKIHCRLMSDSWHKAHKHYVQHQQDSEGNFWLSLAGLEGQEVASCSWGQKEVLSEPSQLQPKSHKTLRIFPTQFLIHHYYDSKQLYNKLKYFLFSISLKERYDLKGNSSLWLHCETWNRGTVEGAMVLIFG